MKKQLKFKICLIIILFYIFIFVFFSQTSYAWTSNFTEDTGADVSEVTWHLTHYTGGFALVNPLTGSTFTHDDFTINETYGWCEWEYQGVTYVVMASATREALEEEDGMSSDNQWWKDVHEAGYNGGGYHSWIHYFHYGTSSNNYSFSTFSFKFEDEDFDSNVYNGIILDSCAAAARINEGDDEILDVHMPEDYDYSADYAFNGKKVILSLTGTWSSSSGTSSSTSKRECYFSSNNRIFYISWRCISSSYR